MAVDVMVVIRRRTRRVRQHPIYIVTVFLSSLAENYLGPGPRLKGLTSNQSHELL